MASLEVNAGTLETKLYFVFNHEDESARGCSEHLHNILTMLRNVPHIPPATDGSPKTFANELKHYDIQICQAIHNYSFHISYYRVTKREHKLSEIRGYIEQDQTNYFSDRRRETLLRFLNDVRRIISATNTTTKQSPATFI